MSKVDFQQSQFFFFFFAQAEAQKHQRKVRKEQKDMDKHRKAIEDVTQSIARLDSSESLVPKNVLGAQHDSVLTEKDGREGLLPTSETIAIQRNCFKVDAEACPTGGILFNDIVTTGVQTAAASPAHSNVISKGSSEPEMDCLESQRMELVASIEKSKKAIELCQVRLKALETLANDRKSREGLENTQAGQLQRWCMYVRNVVAPSTKEEAECTKPGKDGEMSQAMQAVLDEADKLCIGTHKDVSTVKNAFASICWSCRAMEVLRRQPTSNAIESLVTEAQRISLPEDKALKTLRTMCQRADAWNLRFRRALTPVPGTTENFDMKELQELAKSADKIPLVLPYEHRLETILDDDGCRYCLCGGPSDGRFMIGCDKCDKWFHGSCVDVDGDEEDKLDHWLCPTCRGCHIDPNSLAEKFHDAYDCEMEEIEDDDIASKAPDPSTLWPPFGLKKSEAALEALGIEIPLADENRMHTAYVLPNILSAPAVSERGEDSLHVKAPELRAETAQIISRPMEDPVSSNGPNVSVGESLADVKSSVHCKTEPRDESPTIHSKGSHGSPGFQKSLASPVTMSTVEASRQNDGAHVDRASREDRSLTTTTFVDSESSFSMVNESNLSLRVNSDQQGEVAPVAS